MARQKLVHLHTSEDRAPSAGVLNFGEIAVMHNETHPSLFIKTGDSADTENAVAQFIDKGQTEALIDQKISASTEDMIALKTEVTDATGRISALETSKLTAMTVNDVAATITTGATGASAEVTIDSDNVNVGTAITYSGETFVATTASTTDALQALATKIEGIDGVISESNHTHANKALLDTYTQTETDLADAVAKKHEHDNKDELDLIESGDKAKWDDAAASAHSHANKALLDTYTQTEVNLADAVAKKHEHANASVLDGISAEDVQAWDGAVSGLEDKVDKAEGKGLSTNDYTTAEKEKLESIAASAQTNVIESVKVNGTALTVTDKAVDILVAEGTANGTVKVNGVDVAVHGLGSAAYQDTTAFDASGAADTVKTELIGDMTGATKTLGGLEDRIDALTTGSNVTISTTATTENMLKSYTFSQNGSVIGTIDIPKDLVVTSGVVTADSQDRKVLRLTIANQTEPVDILVSDLVDVYTEGNGIEVSTGNVISAKVVAGNGLSVDANGIAMAAASSAGAGAMSAADFDKLASIAASAQVNTIEGVQVNGADLTPDANKKVNVTVTSGTNNGTIAVNGSDVAVTGLKSAAFAESSAFDASGAAEAASAAAITAVVGDMTGDTKTLGALQDAIEGLHLGEDNVLEGVQVNGSDLTITSKKVNVTVTEGATDGTIAVNGSDVAVHGLGSAAYADTTAFDAAGAAGAASAAAVTSANSYTDAQVLSSVTAATGDALVEASVANKTVSVAASTALTAAVANANSALQSVSHGTDGNYVTTTVGTKANGDQTIGVAVDVVDVTAATVSNKGLAEASDVKAYVDDAVAGKNVAATGDTLVSATASNNTVTVAATQDLQDAVTAANASVQGIATGKESGASLDSNRKLDFSEFGIDCGEY